MRDNTYKEKAFRIIRREILSNILIPGHPLNERSLSERLKISKTPIREAIQLLQKEGLVDVVQQKGAFVTQISINDIREIMQIREGLEPIAASIAASFHDTKELCKLENEFAILAEASPRDYEALRESGKRLHKFLLYSTRNKRLIDFLGNLNEQIDRVRAFFYVDLSDDYIDQSFEEHMRILRAVKLADAESAQEIMRSHIRKYWERLKEIA